MEDRDFLYWMLCSIRALMRGEGSVKLLKSHWLPCASSSCAWPWLPFLEPGCCTCCCGSDGVPLSLGRAVGVQGFGIAVLLLRETIEKTRSWGKRRGRRAVPRRMHPSGVKSPPLLLFKEPSSLHSRPMHMPHPHLSILFVATAGFPPAPAFFCKSRFLGEGCPATLA